METIRERDLRQSTEERLKDIKEENATESSRLATLVESLRSEIVLLSSDKLTMQAHVVRLEKQIEDAINGTASMSAESKKQIEDLTRRCDVLLQDLESNKKLLQESRDECSRHSARADGLEQRIEVLRSHQLEQQQAHKAALESAKIEAREQSESQVYDYIADLERKLEAAVLDHRSVNAELERCNALLEEEITESNALRLRLQLHDSQLLQSRRLQGTIKRTQLLSPQVSTRNSYDVQSPLFSEDFGPVSYPNSPATHEYSAPPLRHDETQYQDQIGAIRTEGFPTGRINGSVPPLPRPQVVESTDKISADQLREREADINQLEQENRALKNTIHEVCLYFDVLCVTSNRNLQMRTEMERLQRTGLVAAGAAGSKSASANEVYSQFRT